MGLGAASASGPLSGASRKPGRLHTLSQPALQNSSYMAGSGRCPRILYMHLLPSMVLIQKKQDLQLQLYSKEW